MATTYDEMLATELREDEKVLEQVQGDYWEYLWLFGSQRSGRFFFTNKRVIFYYCLNKKFEIDYDNIASMELCNVGPLIRFVPCGIKVTTKDDQKYHLSLMKRKQYLELMQAQMNNG